MAVKLGELLVSQGLITEKQLQDGLRAQEICGGRLGTNLIELGSVTESALAQLLSEQLGVPYAQQSDFDAIPEEVLRLLPRVMVEKHRVVPLKRKEDHLTLAMADPTDLNVINEICYVTKCTVMPIITSEVLLLHAMERFYGIPRGSRYLHLTGVAPGDFEIVQEPGEDSDGDGDSQRQAPVRSPLKEKGYTTKSAVAQLAEVRRQHDIFEVLRRFVRVYFEQMAVLVFRGESVVGWIQSGCRLSDYEMRQLCFSLAESELFSGGCLSPYVGQVPETEVDRRLFQSLGISTERDVLFVPVLVNNRPIAVVLASGPVSGEIGDRVLIFDTLATKASYAFQILYLKQRILGTGAI